MLGLLESHRESLQVQPPLLASTLSFYKSSVVTRGWLPVLAVNILVVEAFSEYALSNSSGPGFSLVGARSPSEC